MNNNFELFNTIEMLSIENDKKEATIEELRDHSSHFQNKLLRMIDGIRYSLAFIMVNESGSIDWNVVRMKGKPSN